MSKKTQREVPPQMHAKELKAQVKKVLRTFKDDSDLACAIIGCAYVEHCLGTLLENFMTDGSTARGLLQPTAPIAMIHNRRLLAYSLGLISKEIGREIQTIGEIRNVFAHKFYGVSFDDSPVRTLCDNLVADPYGKELTSRQRYVGSVMNVVFYLLGNAEEAKHREKRKHEESWPWFSVDLKKEKGDKPT